MVAAARSALPAGRVAEAVLLVAVGALLLAAFFDGGGSTTASLDTVGVAALVLAASGLALALTGRIPFPSLDGPGVLVVAGAAALTAWAGVSIAWSIAGDRSWEWLDRGVVYLAFVVLGLLAGAVRPVGRVTAVLAVAVAAAIGWALLGVAIPSLAEQGDRIARLQEPVGFWNALALLADAALGLGLWATRCSRVAGRVGGPLLVYGATIVVLLTQSRAGVVGAVAVVGLSLLLSSAWLEDAVSIALSAAPGLVVAAWAFTRAPLVEDGAARSDRVADGWWFALFAIVGAVLVVLLAWRVAVGRLVAEHARRVRSAVVGLCALAALAGVLGLVAAVGNPFSWASSQVSGGECANDPGRLTDLCANNRLAWWGEALDIAADHPVGGTGAGTFELARRSYRDDATAVSEPHSVPLQLLADTGVVGLALGVLVALAAAVGARRAFRLVEQNERPAVAALACVVLAYAVHALVDYDLDFLAVSAPVLVAVGALTAAGRGASLRRAGFPGLVALVASTAAAVVAVALPSLAARDVDRSLAASEEHRVEDAVDAAERARRLDPLSPAPLGALATAADAAGDERAAVAWYEEATRLQPENPDLWYDLGLYHAIATGDQCAAYQALNASYTLDPKSRRWSPGGVLDVARDAVNAGACERG